MPAQPSTEASAPAPVSDYALLRALACDVATSAAEMIRKRRTEVFASPSDRRADGDSVRSKTSETDPVTIVDVESETLIRESLARLRPGDGFLGEEATGNTEPASETGVVWVVDPIDGTVNFLYGVPAYAVSIAAQVDGKTVAGAVVDVPQGWVYSAARGEGATVWRPDHGSKELRVSETESVGMALVSTGFGYQAERRIAQARLAGSLLPVVRDLRRIGAAALDLCLVAAGSLDAHVEHGLNPWDFAAGGLIAEEAGALVRVPPTSARSPQGELVLVATPKVYHELSAVLEELGFLGPIA
ncbi:MAG: inositol monophosphatase family protein [Segniliparus sp.]|uniref:inositol monophosphatase family protein n=1 Tax=Segniliparus sp. TaxID=2804064 RepID=UPI003F371C26